MKIISKKIKETKSVEDENKDDVFILVRMKGHLYQTCLITSNSERFYLDILPKLNEDIPNNKVLQRWRVHTCYTHDEIQRMIECECGYRTFEECAKYLHNYIKNKLEQQSDLLGRVNRHIKLCPVN